MPFCQLYHQLRLPKVSKTVRSKTPLKNSGCTEVFSLLRRVSQRPQDWYLPATPQRPVFCYRHYTGRLGAGEAYPWLIRIRSWRSYCFSSSESYVRLTIVESSENQCLLARVGAPQLVEVLSPPDLSVACRSHLQRQNSYIASSTDG